MSSMNPISTNYVILTSDRVIIALFLATLLVIGVEAGSIGILTSYLVDLRGFTSSGAQVALILFLVGMAIGRLLVGYFSKDTQIVRTILILFGASFMIYTLLYFADIGQASYLLVLLAGLSMSAMFPLILALAGMLYPTMTGTVMGAIKVALPLGGIILPFLMSMITQRTSFQMSLIIFPLAFFLGFVILSLTIRNVKIAPAEKIAESSA